MSRLADTARYLVVTLIFYLYIFPALFNSSDLGIIIAISLTIVHILYTLYYSLITFDILE